MKNILRIAVLIFAPLIMIGCAEEDSAQMNGDTMGADTSMMGEMDHSEMMAGDTLRAALTGSAEVPGPGDEDGSGEAEVVLNSDDNTVCYEISVENIAEATAAHIHTGAAGVSGPPVVNFDIGTNGLSNCVPADAATIQDIQESPTDFYVNVHNSEFGAGAIRGQLGGSTMME